VSKKKEHESRKNYKGYLKGKEKLKHAVLQHPEEGPKSIFNFIKDNMNRRFWVIPWKTWHKEQGFNRDAEKYNT